MVIVLEPSTGRGGAGAVTGDDMTISSAPQHHHQTTRSRFMITDILSSGPRSPCSSPASSSEGPRDLSVHCRGDDSDGHESGTDSGLPGETSSVCSNGESVRSAERGQISAMAYKHGAKSRTEEIQEVKDIKIRRI